jgi:HD-GYP domain-containing protein (c-di-GMP phosphodiesterase class II)
VLGYDLGASAIAIFVAWFYVHAQTWIPYNLGPASLVALVLPVVVLRHIYGMYYRLQENGRELLEVMVKAIEARDPYTSGHSIRVSTLAKVIAIEAGLSTKDVEDVGAAGLLHDVGKIHEEFAPLLRKEDKLTDEEFELLQTHSAKSAELVGIISGFRGAVESMVLSHHERWDGNGYPNGLSTDEIPFGSRIIMISDTIDAMTTDRPYRKALGFEAVVSELQRCKGTQFDPNLVELVIDSLAVRRILAEQIDTGVKPTSDVLDSPGRSKRVPKQAKSFWRTGLA